MKKIPILIITLFAAVSAGAQNPSAYFMEGSTFRMQFNPAFAPHRGYINVPGIGGIQVGMNNSLGLDDVLFPRDGRLVTLLDPLVSSAEALRGIRSKNTLLTDDRINLIGFGSYTRNRKHFWSFDINLRTSATLSLPGRLAEFVKYGTDGPIRGLEAAAEAYVDAGFAYSFPLLDDRLYVGAKAKFVAGIGRLGASFDRMDVTLQGDRWAVDALARLDMNLPGVEADCQYDENGEPYFEPGDIDMSTFKPTGYGFAVDLGATYDILPDLQASLAVTDLGFICWNKADNLRGHAEETVEYTGLAVENNQTFSSPDFSFDDLTRFRRDESTARTRMLQATINAGLEYFMWDRRVGFGLLYQARFYHLTTLHGVTGSVNFMPVKWFTLTGSYTRTSRCGGSLGLALNLCPGWINFFVATDLATAKFTPQYVPVRQRSMNVTFGLGFPLGKRGLRTEK